MFTRKFDDKLYKIISVDGCGIELKVPRYKKSSIRIGNKSDAEKKGLGPKGKNKFYTIADGSVVVDGYLSEPTVENKVEMKVKGNISISQANWDEIKEEVDFMLKFNEK